LALKRDRRESRHGLKFFTIVLVGLILLLGAYGWWQRDAVADAFVGAVHGIRRQISEKPAMPKDELFVEEQVEESEIASTSIVISAVGDFLPGDENGIVRPGSFGDEYLRNADATNYFLANVASYLGSDDLTIANLECPLTEVSKPRQKGAPKLAETDHSQTSTAEVGLLLDVATEGVATAAAIKPKPKSYFWFRGKASYARVLTEGSIEAVTLANNHTLDFGEQGRKDTLATLKEAGIVAFDAQKPEIVYVRDRPVGLLGYYNPGKWLKAQIMADIQNLRAQGAELVIVSFHWGEERATMPNALQKEIGRYTIESGANIVLGHHPHVIQPVEKWQQGYIVYSLGNFMFGGNRNPSDKDTYIYQQTIHFTDDGISLEEPVFIPCRISSVTSRNDFRPTPVTGAEAERIMRRINKPV
jgi:poly-gamma-glutamate synthesis protein (capsule biosynthesis protein)